MAKKVKPIPEGLHTLTPHLVIRDAAKAIAFYEKAFGAEELNRVPAPDGKHIWHAALRFGTSRLYLADEAAATGAKAAQTLGGSPVMLTLNVEDADAMFERAVKAGAKVKAPLADMFWGDRYGQVSDPFGLDWAISTHVKDLSPEEMRQAGQAAAAETARR